MSFYLNKIVDWMTTPLTLGAGALVLAAILLARGRHRRLGWALFAFGVSWLWFWSMPLASDAITAALERRFPPQRVETLPVADAIVLLGGGMGVGDATVYPNIYAAGDRTWHAARLYHARKAPLIVPTGGGCDRAELPFLLDLGVPRDHVKCEVKARNTEENARFVADMLRDAVAGRKAKVLLVTSALHMPRALMLYRRYAPGLEIVPAACDHEAIAAEAHTLTPGSFLPNVYSLTQSAFAIKEVVGYLGYGYLRR